MADEGERDAAQATARHRLHAIGRRRDFAPFCGRQLPDDAVVLRGISWLKMQGAFLLAMVGPGENLLVFIGRQLDIHKVLSAPRRNEQKRMERLRAHVERQLVHLVHEAVVHLGNGRVHLHAYAVRAKIAYAGKGLVERSLPAAERVLTFRRRKIKRHRHARYPMRRHLARTLVVDERAVRADDRVKPLLMRIIDDVPDVCPHERLASGEDENRVGDGGDVVYDALAFVQRQFAGIRLALRRSATMGTG